MLAQKCNPGVPTRSLLPSNPCLTPKPLPRLPAQQVYCKAAAKSAAVTTKGRQTGKQTGRQTIKPGQTIRGKTLSNKGTTQRGLETVDPSRRNKTVRGQQQQQQEERRGSRFYLNFTGFPFPLGPFFQRKTVRNEVSTRFIFVFFLRCGRQRSVHWPGMHCCVHFDCYKVCFSVVPSRV